MKEYLFNQRKVELLFTELEGKIMKEASALSIKVLSSENLEERVGFIMTHYDKKVPTLIKEKIVSSIEKVELLGEQMPSGTPIFPNKKYEVEFAIYCIPFNGDSEFFNCVPTLMTSNLIEGKLNQAGIIVQFTNYGKISGNVEYKNKIKEDIIQIVDKIENNLENLRSDYNKFITYIKPKVFTLLNKRISEDKIRKENQKDINPFN